MSAKKQERRVLLLVAMNKEYDLVHSWLKRPKSLDSIGTRAHVGWIGDIECLLVLTGIGKVCAALHAYQGQLQFQPELIVNLGVCGAIDTSLEVATPVLSSAFAYHDVWCGEGNEFGQVQDFPARYPVAPELLAHFAQFHPELSCGLFTSGDYFIPSHESIAQLLEHFPDAKVVDMESTAIAQIAYLYHLPYFSLRTVSDTPVRTTQHAQQYAQFWESPTQAFDNLHHILAQFLTTYRQY